jgi:hypothetical protein
MSYHIQSAAVDGMKVGRSIVSLINKRSPTSSLQARAVAVAVDPQLAQLSESIESMTQSLYKGEAKVDEIVSYQADRVYSSTSTSARTSTSTSASKAQTAATVATVADVSLATPPSSSSSSSSLKAEKPKARSSMLKKLLSRKNPSA